MSDVLIKHLVLTLDKRLAVFTAKASSSDFFNDETSLRTAAYMISEIIMPCCCMLCNKAKLTEILKQTKLCHGQPILTKTIVDLVYNDLARYNGLG